jgi:ATP-dependent Lon protease
VLPVGGIKEKLLAAHAAGMAKVLVPARNMPDVQVSLPCSAGCKVVSGGVGRGWGCTCF